MCDHISTDVFTVREGDRSSDTIYFDQWYVLLLLTLLAVYHPMLGVLTGNSVIKTKNMIY